MKPPAKISPIEYTQRRKRLVDAIRKEYGHMTSGGVLVWANFENDATTFRQDETFWYLSGCCEPASLLWIDLDGSATLYVPNTGGMRARWVSHTCEPDSACLCEHALERINFLGEVIGGYQLAPRFSEKDCHVLVERIKRVVHENGVIFWCQSLSGASALMPRWAMRRLCDFIPGLAAMLADVTDVLASLRRTKSADEIALISFAIECTVVAHQRACHAIATSHQERLVAAEIAYSYACQGVTSAFVSIVSGGVCGPIIHYEKCDSRLEPGELVIIDCGARVQGYCADLTRTYPVSGKFSDRQRELYQAVHDAQQEAAAHVRPGVWLSNKEKPEMSLYHIAVECFKKHGLEKYFIHGIGHFLGLSTHDVGDVTQPLQAGDVITIEPGLYMPDDPLGIRIEDDFLITSDGCQCLSEQLPRTSDEVEKFFAQHAKL